MPSPSKNVQNIFTTPKGDQSPKLYGTDISLQAWQQAMVDPRSVFGPQDPYDLSPVFFDDEETRRFAEAPPEHTLTPSSMTSTPVQDKGKKPAKSYNRETLADDIYADDDVQGQVKQEDPIKQEEPLANTSARPQKPKLQITVPSLGKGQDKLATGAAGLSHLNAPI